MVLSRSDVVRRYATWIERYRWPVILASIAFAAIAAVVATRISILADFSYLLPQNARSVQDLRAIEKRSHVVGTAMVVVESDHPASRHQAALMARDIIEKLGPEWIASVTFDDRVKHRYAWDHRWLLAPLDDLTAARDALRRAIEQAKLDANPLYVPLDDPPPTPTQSTDTLRRKLHDAEYMRDDPGEYISKDRRVQMMLIHTGFSTGDVDRDRVL